MAERAAVAASGAALPAAADAAAGLRVRQPRERVTTQRRIYGRLPLWAWISIFGLCFAAVLPVLQTSGQTEAGRRLLELEAQREALQSEVRGLAADVGQLASLQRIEHEARHRLGLIPAPPTHVIRVDHPPPARTLPARFEPTFEDGETNAPPFWQAILDVLIID